ncbi:MAG: ABC transporter ATP-binding protein [Verrucomicrobiales bacterium]|nr:ABC transporter ATP-binding protein [Verrucomicrobiales bacterium]HQW28658.1 ABC transporter ATP-binding protein [Verrucomicrobiales bacterium]
MTQTSSLHPLVRLIDVRKEYVLGHRTVQALRGLTLEIAGGSFVVLQGPSGSGKTTLLNLIGCIAQPTSGQVLVAGKDTSRLSDNELSYFRRRMLGFVFQNFNLIPVLTAAENIEYPLRIIGVPAAEARKKTRAILEEMNLLEEAGQRPSELSGGQCQRVAIGRALVTQPELIIADEPTANLDSVTGSTIIRIMHQMRDRLGTTFLISTHDPQIAALAEERWMLRDGLLTDV